MEDSGFHKEEIETEDIGRTVIKVSINTTPSRARNAAFFCDGWKAAIDYLPQDFED